MSTSRLETRAARLVTALQKAGHPVKRMWIVGEEIHVDFEGASVDASTEGERAYDEWKRKYNLRKSAQTKA